ncbi:MAG: hypothetical protein BWY76_03339 [bacterium ADurb.Bin429]|nr:MAG: hypothetical protein BWY76_03339 [bacterium ADurb.Bin429]
MRGDTNDPVKGATVNAYTTRSRVLGSVLATTTTDDTGAYILHFAAHGDTNIIIIADPAAESGLAQIELSMAVSAGATISGNVTLQRPAIVSNVGVTTTGTMTRVGANISATAHTVESDGEVYDGTATLTPVL